MFFHFLFCVFVVTQKHKKETHVGWGLSFICKTCVKLSIHNYFIVSYDHLHIYYIILYMYRFIACVIVFFCIGCYGVTTNTKEHPSWVLCVHYVKYTHVRQVNYTLYYACVSMYVYLIHNIIKRFLSTHIGYVWRVCHILTISSIHYTAYRHVS